MLLSYNLKRNKHYKIALSFHETVPLKSHSTVPFRWEEPFVGGPVHGVDGGSGELRAGLERPEGAGPRVLGPGPRSPHARPPLQARPSTPVPQSLYLLLVFLEFIQGYGLV